jgi:hypothetical protein
MPLSETSDEVQVTDGPAGREFPRPISPREREWMDWILPADRSGYMSYRQLVGGMVVIGNGRRGEGEIILGAGGSIPDMTSPLAPVFAYGAIESKAGTISITIREISDGQISVEIVSHRSEEIPSEFEELRRWTYSTWTPGGRCPQCGEAVREVSMHPVGAAAERLVLALCTADRRIWVYDSSTGVNRLIPVTNYYNDLMLHKNIRDPKIALESMRLFSDLSTYTDADLTYAFFTYNKIKAKVHIQGVIEPDQKESRGLAARFLKLFSRQ